MRTLAPGITVNGVRISPEQIDAEVQYHPCASLMEAKYEAMQALVVRELLCQQALAKGLANREQLDAAPDAFIEALLSQELAVPSPTEEECLRYYHSHRQKFCTSPLFEVSHILYLAPSSDREERIAALGRARAALAQISQNPSLFVDIARTQSGCPSRQDGGRLGQIGKGQTVPAFEKALLGMQEGDTSTEPIESEVGFHIIRVHRRSEGSQLPFEVVSEWIARMLGEQVWRKAFTQYIEILASQAAISGFKIRSASSPLLQ